MVCDSRLPETRIVWDAKSRRMPKDHPPQGASPEAEHLVAGVREAQMVNLQAPREGILTASGKPSTAPAIPGAAATPKVARDCRQQLNSNSFQYIARIENRRVFAADPETGLVMGLSHFRHPMDNLPYMVKAMDGSTIERNKKNMAFAPFDLPAGWE